MDQVRLGLSGSRSCQLEDLGRPEALEYIWTRFDYRPFGEATVKVADVKETISPGVTLKKNQICAVGLVILKMVCSFDIAPALFKYKLLFALYHDKIFD